MHISLCSSLPHVLAANVSSVYYNSTYGTISFTFVFRFCSKPSALRPAKMEEPVQLQIPAVVFMVGLGTLAAMVCIMCACV